MTTLSAATFEELLTKGTAPAATKEDLFMLGECYENGGEHKTYKNAAPTKDLQKAIEYFLKASDLGHVTATRYAAYWCRTLAPKAPEAAKFAQNAFDLYTKAATAPMNDPRAMTVMGYFYEKGFTTTGADIVGKDGVNATGGVVVSPDNKKAAEWYQKAVDASGGADAADVTATVNLALMYEKGFVSGNTTPSIEDKKRAFDLFKAVADKPNCSNAAALINTGLYYEKGEEEEEGVLPKKDMATALNNYYLRAAKLGDSTAMAIAGCCFETGQGCKVDYDKAADFYVKGAMAGNNHAREGLRRLRDAGHI